MTARPDIAAPAAIDCPAGWRWLPDAARTDGRDALRSDLAAGTVSAIIRTPFADRHELPTTFWCADDPTDAAEAAFITGWLRIARPQGWCKWIEGFVYVPDPTAETGDRKRA